jgi:hypothetical protein
MVKANNSPTGDPMTRANAFLYTVSSNDSAEIKYQVIEDVYSESLEEMKGNVNKAKLKLEVHFSFLAILELSYLHSALSLFYL